MKRIILSVFVLASTAAAQQNAQPVTQQVFQFQDKVHFEAAGVPLGPAPMMATRFGGASTVVKGGALFRGSDDRERSSSR